MNRFFIGLLAVMTASIVFTMLLYRTPDAATAQFGDMSLRVEYALTESAREKGLSGRAHIPENYAMLFTFPNADYQGFWMKDMLAPIDIFWLDNKGRVISIISNLATSTYPNVFYPPVPVQYVLETAAGFARNHSITIGTPLLLKNFPTVLK